VFVVEASAQLTISMADKNKMTALIRLKIRSEKVRKID
jgi:hypothetical protein